MNLKAQNQINMTISTIKSVAQNINILLVDNNGISTNELRNILESVHFTVYQVNDIENISSYLKNLEIDLIVVNQNQFLKQEKCIEIIKSLNKPVLVIASLFFINLQKELSEFNHVFVLRLPKSKEEIIQTIVSKSL